MMSGTVGEVTANDTVRGTKSCVNESNTERVKQVKDALGLPLSKPIQEQSQKLENLIREYADVFALTDDELGHTDIVEHTIDTGDYSPIKIEFL